MASQLREGRWRSRGNSAMSGSMGRRILLILSVVIAMLVPAVAQIDQQPKVHARLISDRDAVRPGGTFAVALEENIRPGWHTYWLNPGDAGAPTEVKWSLPSGWTAGPIQWPYPQREPVGPLMDYGYENTVWLLMDLHAPVGAAAGPVNLRADVTWLVCAEVCVPEEAALNLTVFIDPKAGAPDRITAERFAAARARLPVASPWPMTFARSNGLNLYIRSPALAGAAKPVDAQFFPARAGEIADPKPQAFGFAKDGLVLRLPPGTKAAGLSGLDGIVVLTSADKSVQAIEVHAAPGIVPPADFNGVGELSLLLALLFAFLGGLILNIMPCVLPVLAMKALALAGHAGADKAHARAESFSYSLGAILSFVVFGLLIVALRAGGASIGWGFQLQEPVVVVALALVMFAVGLNLSGVYEVGAVTAGESLTRKRGMAGAFFTGVLAVAVAAPCTAPFMAAAIGYGFTQATPVVLAIFLALGLGFALPFLLLGFWPSMHRILPKPGPWMLWLKRILAIPMYGAAAWLLWVLGQQVDRAGLIAALAAVAALGAALAVWGFTRAASSSIRGAGAFAALLVFLGALYAVGLVATAKSAAPAAIVHYAGMKVMPYSVAKLTDLRREHRAIFIDATASWCITCLVNEEAALSHPAVRDAFEKHHVAFLVADWTNRDPQVTALLQAHGRPGVPLYLYYAPGADEPRVLPQILTEGEVIRAVAP
ncbi:MAG: thioredoxin family protein [Alphaproteobacteria bacterium]|nr:thioredoxin family protein [Alphaproteobacteria bacterium]